MAYLLHLIIETLVFYRRNRCNLIAVLKDSEANKKNIITVLFLFNSSSTTHCFEFYRRVPGASRGL